MPYTLEAGRVIVGPSGLRLVALQRLEIPASEHPDGCTGAYTIHATEADRIAHQIVDALNAAPSPAVAAPEKLYQLPPVNGAQCAAIFAALRFYQAEEQGEPANRSDAIHDLATCGPDGEVISLDETGIDELCEYLNIGPAGWNVAAPTFCVGYNTPGYMPEGEPEGEYESWSEAVEAVAAIISEDARHYEEEDGADVAAIQGEEAYAITFLSADPTPRNMSEGVDVVFRGRAYFIRRNEESAS